MMLARKKKKRGVRKRVRRDFHPNWMVNYQTSLLYILHAHWWWAMKRLRASAIYRLPSTGYDARLVSYILHPMCMCTYIYIYIFICTLFLIDLILMHTNERDSFFFLGEKRSATLFLLLPLALPFSRTIASLILRLLKTLTHFPLLRFFFL